MIDEHLCSFLNLFTGTVFDSVQCYGARAAERIFIYKKGHCNVKKGTNGVHADNYR